MNRVYDEDAWLDMRPGERALTSGRLEGAIVRGSTGMVITMPDWSGLYVEILDPQSTPRVGSGQHVEVELIRTEDGLATMADLIKQVDSPYRSLTPVL